MLSRCLPHSWIGPSSDYCANRYRCIVPDLGGTAARSDRLHGRILAGALVRRVVAAVIRTIGVVLILAGFVVVAVAAMITGDYRIALASVLIGAANYILFV